MLPYSLVYVAELVSSARRYAEQPSIRKGDNVGSRRRKRQTFAHPIGRFAMTLPQIVRLVLLSALWGSMFLLVKYALADFSPAEVAFFQAVIGAIGLFVIVSMQGGEARARLGDVLHRPGWALLLGALAIAAPFLLITLGELRVPSGLAGVLASMAPMFIALFAPLLDPSMEINRRQGAGLIVGLFGVGLVVGVHLEPARIGYGRRGGRFSQRYHVHASLTSRLTVMTTSEKATQKSMTCPRLSVHHTSFLWALCHELVLSTTHRLVAQNGAGLPFREISASRPRSSSRSRGAFES